MPRSQRSFMPTEQVTQAGEGDTAECRVELFQPIPRQARSHRGTVLFRPLLFVRLQRLRDPKGEHAKRLLGYRSEIRVL